MQHGSSEPDPIDRLIAIALAAIQRRLNPCPRQQRVWLVWSADGWSVL